MLCVPSLKKLIIACALVLFGVTTIVVIVKHHALSTKVQQEFSCQFIANTIQRFKPVTNKLCNVSEIDIVMTWVNSNDLHWQNKFKKKLESTVIYDYTAAEPMRFRDFEQLRYAIRSVRKFISWSRKIFLVTDEQVPEWLNITVAKLHHVFLIDHAEIFPETNHLPVFNSYAIELNLHRIKGLSECFIYMQDDQIFLKPLPLDTFYNSEQDKLRHYVVSNPIIKERTMVEDTVPNWINTLIFSHDQYCERFNMTRSQCDENSWKFSEHVQQIYKKTWLNELENLFEAQFNETRAHSFRTDKDISITMTLYNHHVQHKYSNNCSLDQDLNFVLTRILSDPSDTQQEVEQLIGAHMACIQDYMIIENRQSIDILLSFLQQLLPQPLEFERSG